MITLESRVSVTGISGKQITDFLSTCDDARYQRWWPGTHLRYRVRGDRVFMDEYIGRRRLRMTGRMSELIPGRKLVWRWKGLAQLVLEFHDDLQGVQVTHTIHAGFNGVGRVLDPLFRLYFSAGFRQAMDEHVKLEFPRLGALLLQPQTAPWNFERHQLT